MYNYFICIVEMIILTNIIILTEFDVVTYNCNQIISLFIYVYFWLSYETIFVICQRDWEACSTFVSLVHAFDPTRNSSNLVKDINLIMKLSEKVLLKCNLYNLSRQLRELYTQCGFAMCSTFYEIYTLHCLLVYGLDM